MKIMITGYSGSGKSTLCRTLQERYQIPSLHLDSVQFLPGWDIRPRDEQRRIVRAFLDENPDGWVIDGNYSALSYDRRRDEADVIIQLLFSRMSCLSRCLRRYRENLGHSRPDMPEGCNEKMDLEFVRWILWDGRVKKARDRYLLDREQFPDKVVTIRNQKQLDAYLGGLGLQ